jgi:hypothetical protein
MAMKLALAIALECSSTEYKVELIDGREIITAKISIPMQAVLKIFPGQLLALDTNLNPPEIVYRWHRGKIERVDGERLVLGGMGGRTIEVGKARGLEANPQPGDWVFATGGTPTEQGEVVDTAVEGRPAHPVFLREYLLPKVEEFWRKRFGVWWPHALTDRVAMEEKQSMDDDLDEMSHAQLIAEAKKLRAGIRAHRDATKHELCWHHPALWGLLPEKTDPVPVVPEWPEFIRGCVRYRQSLDEQAPDAPRTREPFRMP